MEGVRIENITIKYDDFTAVEGVSLHVKPGELVTILGPSGCGKTTLLRSIAGFVTPVSGHIFLEGKEITHLPPQHRGTAMIFQNYALWPHMTIEQNVEYGLKLKGVPKEVRRKKAVEMLKLVKMESQIGKMPTQISGGQQQRIALARALAVDPDVLLCDEPLSNLDAKLRVELRTEIREISKRLGITVIYVTHDQSEALAISDRIAILRDGELQQVGPPLEVFHDPDNLFVGEFIGESSTLKGVLEEQEGNKAKIRIGDAGLITAYFEEQLEPGAELKILIRPQDVNVIPNKKRADNEENILKGIIRTNSFMGDHVRVNLELPTEERLIIAERKHIEETSRMGVDVEAFVQVNPEKVLCFLEERRIR